MNRFLTLAVVRSLLYTASHAFFKFRRYEIHVCFYFRFGISSTDLLATRR